MKEGKLYLQMSHIAFVFKNTIFHSLNLIWTQAPVSEKNSDKGCLFF